MMKLLLFSVLCVWIFIQEGEAGVCSNVVINDEWPGGWSGTFTAEATEDSASVTVELEFNHEIDTIECWEMTLEKVDDMHFTFTSSTGVTSGDTVTFTLIPHAVDSHKIVRVVNAHLNGIDVCEGGGGWTTIPPMTNPCEETGATPYDYPQVLCMSILFYEAQRSGKLPPEQRVTWRGDSALDDGSDSGEDLEGGYYDAGDHVKFGFPLAYTVTALAWGIESFEAAYVSTGQIDYAREAVKWGADYLLKAHTGTTELFGQVGDGNLDHAYWGRPEEMTMERPSWKVDATAPGSDLAGETAAALAATSIVFKEVDPDYSKTCLDAAKELFDFADQYRELYHVSIPNAGAFYKSWSGYGDELAWGSAWLAKATGEQEYLTKAKNFYDEFSLNSDASQLSWDDKRVGVYILLTELDGDSKYQSALEGFLDFVMNQAPYTPAGMVYLDMWGSLRHVANVAFVGLKAASMGINADEYITWAEGQMAYILGSQGHSFVVGFGKDPPQQPHHRASSCPDLPESCTDGWAQNNPGPNPQILYGALVGGPDEDDTYIDSRDDYIHNEVACDYNALFTGALAALIALQ